MAAGRLLDGALAEEAVEVATLTFEPARHVYHLDGERLPSVTQILQPLINYDGVPNGILQHAADRGTAVHLATEFWDDGDLDEESVDPEILPYVRAWQRFRAESGFEVLRSEVRVYSPRHRYAGTVDCIGVMRGRLTMVEKKTTAVLHPATAIQVAAYRRAYNETCAAPARIRHSYSVHLRRDGTYRLDEWTPDEDHWAVFLALLNPDHSESAATLAAWKAKYL